MPKGEYDHVHNTRPAGGKPTCLCGKCPKCKNRANNRRWYNTHRRVGPPPPKPITRIPRYDWDRT